MFKKNEMLKTAILAALVLFSTVAVFAIVVMVSNGGSITPVHALRMVGPYIPPTGGCQYCCASICP